MERDAGRFTFHCGKLNMNKGFYPQKFPKDQDFKAPFKSVIR